MNLDIGAVSKNPKGNVKTLNKVKMNRLYKIKSIFIASDASILR